MTVTNPMRELKFRIWDEKNKHFGYVTLGPRTISWPSGSWTRRAELRTTEEFSGLSFPNTDGMWEQLTGYKDQAAKDIYEGDFVELIDRPEEGVFHCTWDPEYMCFEFRHIQNYLLNGHCLGGGSYPNLKVVGNGRENGELFNDLRGYVG